MNERIRELWDEANHKWQQRNDRPDLEKSVPDIFAELIVKDVRWVMQTAADDFILDENYDAVKGVGRCMNRVKQHFGVE